VYTYLTMTRGSSIGSRYPLPSDGQLRIGRDAECEIMLTDPRCSRVHAVVDFDNAAGGWLVRDMESRNGTFVNEQKIDEALLAPEARLRVGDTEFMVETTPSENENSIAEDPLMTQTVIQEASIGDTGSFAVSALQNRDQAKDFLLLYQLALRLLDCTDPDQVIEDSLQLAHGRTRAAVVGFLWITDEGQFRPKQVIPEAAAGKVSLSDTLTEIVLSEHKSIWTACQRAGTSAQSLSHFADAICVPLISGDTVIGAIHVYLEDGHFSQSDMDFTQSLGSIMAMALARARVQMQLQADRERLVVHSANFDEMIGDSKPMRDLKSRIARVAKASGSVLIRGESGAGKELVARALHKASPRSDRPLLSVNCAAIPVDLMESQLFGHKKGAFTGADADHIGYFQQADLGTLFLDEVGELTLEGQAKLLRILEGHPFLPVGGSKEISVDVRVIAATNRDLAEFVREKRFREDLFYRLSVFELIIPPLRERGQDIETLLEHFLSHFRLQHNRPGLEYSPEAKEKLLGYAWPGNVRQLRNVIDSAVVMADGDLIQPHDLGLRDAGGGQLESLRIDFWEQRLITESLTRTGGNVEEAAKLLGIGRATVYRKIEEYGIER